MEVTVENNNIEAGIRLLRRALKRDDIHAAVAFRLAHVKPSERKAAKERRCAIRRHRMEKRIQRAMERQGNGRDGGTYESMQIREFKRTRSAI
jgi:ribosomal protein S21